MKEIRAKLLKIDPEVMLTAMRIGKSLYDAKEGGYCAGFNVLDIPEDATIHHIYHQPSMRCFVAYVEHPSFEEVPCGTVPPYFDDWATTKRINVFVDRKSRILDHKPQSPVAERSGYIPPDHPDCESREESDTSLRNEMDRVERQVQQETGISLSEIEQSSWRDRPPLA